MKKFGIIFVLVMFAFDAAARFRVVDGDSLEIGKRRIRLEGIDAPEFGQICRDKNGREYDCGKAATEYLKEIIGDKKVECELMSIDRYKREVSICHAGGVNLNKEMAASGKAVAYGRYYDGFVKDENEAKKAERGIWQGKFMRPEFHRALNGNYHEGKKR